MENEKNQVVETTKKKSKKKWIIIAIIIVALVAVFATSDSESPTVESITGDNTTESNQTETQNIKVGNSVSNDEVKISYKSCNINFKKYSAYADVKSGYKVVEAIFDFENISANDIILEGFECYADGVKCEEFYSVENYSSPTLESVSAGRKLVDASVYYEVPAKAEVIELEYEADYWSGEKYIFIIE